MSFSTGGKRHSHPVVKALYYHLLRRIENKKLILPKPVSIVESVMPQRRAWRGVGGNADREETRTRFTILCVFTAWRWYMSKSVCTTNKRTKKKCTRYSLLINLLNAFTFIH